jgi:hypothetical protein
MSRSFKKTPGFCDRNPCNKRRANKRVRRDWTLASGGAYCKCFESWNICDYRFLFFSRRSMAMFYEEKPWKPSTK